MEERRDVHRRAQTLKRVIAWFRGQTGGASDVPPEVAQTSAARRILSHLAVRGLARKTSAGWVPQQALVSPSPIERIDPEL